MERRHFMRLAAGSAAAVGLAACTSSAVEESEQTDDQADAAGDDAQQLAQEASGDSSLPEIQMEMPTSWPLGLDTIFGGAEVFAQRLRVMSGGRFDITPRAGGEVVPPLEILGAVEEGSAPVGHTASYYYLGRSNALGFGTALPFGLTARQQNAWLYEGGGLEMLRPLYAEEFNLIQWPAGNTGVQMGGWFNSELSGIQDVQGLTFRIPGLGGEVMTRLGATVQVIPGGEIFQALDTGAFDAAEWVGPYDDEKLGLQNAARFYYYPGWWEPGPTLEVQMNLDRYNELPSIYQDMIETAAHQANTTMMARYDALNPPALQSIVESGVELREFPQDIMQAASDASFELYDEFAQADTRFAEIYESWNGFRQAIQRWHGRAEQSMLSFLTESAGAGGQ